MENQPCFLLGAATSSYQVEGGTINNDWDYFMRTNSITNRIATLTRLHRRNREFTLEPAGEAAKFWDPKNYESDFDNAASLGLNCFRISIEWARIEPEKDRWDENAIEHYRCMLKNMQKKGLIPIVTLNHFTLPLWVLTPPREFTETVPNPALPLSLRQVLLATPSSTDPYWNSLRGWESLEMINAFIKFVEKAVTEFKDLVDYWLTINEPVICTVGNGFISGTWPPGFFLDGDRAKAALHNLIEAHVRAYDKITDLDDVDADGDRVPKRVGFSHGMVVVKPIEFTRELDQRMVTNNMEAIKRFTYFMNDYFLNAIVNGEEDLNYLNTLQIHDEHSEDFVRHDHWKDKVDFIGLNYFGRARVYYSKIFDLSSTRFVGGASINSLQIDNDNSSGILSDLGWEIYPKGLYDLIMQINNQWRRPILITENGVADKSDLYRAPYIVAHLQQIKRAVHDGASVIGYLHWSLIDNYEWLEGYRSEAKFGLFSIDHDKRDFHRKVTKGAQALRLIIEESAESSKHRSVANSGLARATAKYGSFNENGTDITFLYEGD